jgi:hypothetical protein
METEAAVALAIIASARASIGRRKRVICNLDHPASWWKWGI